MVSAGLVLASVTKGGKTSLVCPTSKAQVYGQLISRGYGAAVYGWGRGSGFFYLCEEIFFLSRNTRGLSSHRGSSFLGILLASFFSFKGWNIYYKFDQQLENRDIRACQLIRQINCLTRKQNKSLTMYLFAPL